jgi:hypothetical protein
MERAFKVGGTGRSGSRCTILLHGSAADSLAQTHLKNIEFCKRIAQECAVCYGDSARKCEFVRRQRANKQTTHRVCGETVDGAESFRSNTDQGI